MSKRMVATLVAVLMMLCVSALLAKDNPVGIAQKQSATFYQPTVIGGTLVPAGNYTITHEMQGDTHYMIFKLTGGKVEVKTKCSLVPLEAKASRSEQRFVENANNQQVLVEMTFRGDTAKHVLAQ